MEIYVGCGEFSPQKSIFSTLKEKKNLESNSSFWDKNYFFILSDSGIVLQLNLQDKAPYEATAAKRKAEYNKTMVAYNKKQVTLVPQFIAPPCFYLDFVRN